MDHDIFSAESHPALRPHASITALDLLKLRAEKRKAEIGFESQQRKREEDDRKRNQEGRKIKELAIREAAEKRKQEVHKWNLSLAEAKLDNQLLHNSPPIHSEPGAQQRMIAAENAA